MAPWFGVAILVACFLFIPLSAWAATGSWRAGLYAAERYLRIMAFLVAIGSGVGLVMAIAEHGFAGVWAYITGH